MSRAVLDRDVKVKLESISGNIVFYRKYSNTNELALDLGNLEPGVFFMKIILGDRVVVKKIILK